MANREDIRGSDDMEERSSMKQFSIIIDGDGSVRSGEYVYDVYIYYELEDHDFVKQHIINYLDLDFYGNHKVCTEIKDFLPGRHMADVMVEAMKKSLWTFIVFSKHSVENGHTFYLYKQCVKHSALERVVPIIIDDVEIPEPLFDLNTSVDFTLMPEEEFHKRIVQTMSQMGNLIPDTRPRKRRVNPRQRPPLSPQCSDDIPSNPSEDENQENQNCTKPVEYAKKQLDPHIGKAIFVRKNRKPAQVIYDAYSDEQLSDTCSILSEDDSRKWSVEQFHDNPEEYLKRFHHTNRSSYLFRKIEKTILGDILPMAGDNGCIVDKTILVLLSCCTSSLVKKRALEILEQALVMDDLQSPSTADGLMATEERLRDSLLDEPFKSETVEFQTSRLIAYGRLLFYIAMHVEKKHLSIDPAKLLLMSQISDIVNERLKQVKHLTYQMTYALHLVSHAYFYLVKLLQGYHSRVAGDNISDQIDQFSNVTNFSYFSPLRLLERKLKRDTHWIYMDIILSYVGNRVFDEESYLRVLLQHLALLLQDYPEVKVQYKSGVLLSVSRILAKLTIYHKTRDVRIAAVKGYTSPKTSPGLKDIWVSELFNKDPEFSLAFSEIVRSLLVNALDLEVRQLVHTNFFIPMYSVPTSGEYACIRDEESVILNVVAKHLTEQYQKGGDLLTFDSKPKIIHHSETAHIVEGYFNYTTKVAIKLPRSFGDFNEIYANQTTVGFLKSELEVLKTLDHDNVLHLFTWSPEEFIPLHFVVEYMDGGNLLDHLHAGRNRSLMLIDTNCQLDMCIQVAKALAYLKNERVVHRDICAYNVLIRLGGHANCNQRQLKLSGFSMARRVNSGERREYAEGTNKYDSVLIRWSDPESLAKGVWSLQTDIWMFVCLVFEIFTLGAHPFPECQEAVDAVLMFERGHRLMQQHCVPSDINLLIQEGMYPNHLNRITISKCLKRLEDTRGDWAAARVEDSHVENYPDIPRRKMEKITPCAFQKLQSAQVGRSQGRKVSKVSPNHGTTITSRVLDAPDEIDASNADQPVPIFKILDNLAPCLINQEPLKETNWNIIKSLKKLDPQHVVQVYGLDRSDPVVNEALLETQTLTGGNIMEAILHNPSTVKVMHIVDCMVQIVEGLQHLHNMAHLVHTDLRAQYILVDKERNSEGFFRVKIGRLGRCRPLFRGAVDREGRVMDSTPIPNDSLRWAPVEVIQAPAFFSRASDIYSLALVFWQMLYAMQVSENPDFRCIVPHPEWPLEREVFRFNLLMDKHPEKPAHCPDWAYLLIKLCLRDRNKRPSLDYIRETLTSKEPFKSELLQSVKRQLEEISYKTYISYDETQPDEAPYLDRHPNTLPTKTQWCDEKFDEKPEFFLQGFPWFGFPAEEHEWFSLQRKQKRTQTGKEDVDPNKEAIRGHYYESMDNEWNKYTESDHDGDDLYCEIDNLEEDPSSHAYSSTSIGLSMDRYANFEHCRYRGELLMPYNDEEEGESQDDPDPWDDPLVETLREDSFYINLSKGADYSDTPVYDSMYVNSSMCNTLEVHNDSMEGQFSTKAQGPDEGEPKVSNQRSSNAKVPDIQYATVHEAYRSRSSRGNNMNQVKSDITKNSVVEDYANLPAAPRLPQNGPELLDLSSTNKEDNDSDNCEIYDDVLDKIPVSGAQVAYSQEKFIHMRINDDDEYRQVTRNVVRKFQGKKY